MHIFLSPHFDDATGSCGGLIRQLRHRGARAAVMTIMGGVPWRRPGGAAKVLVRRLENIFAARALGAQRITFGFLDGIFRKDFYPRKPMLFDGSPLRETELVAKIAERIKKCCAPTDIIYVPAGLGSHVDHRIVAAAAKLLPNKVIFYEEFFYDWKSGENVKGYKKFHLAPDILREKIRAAKKHRIEMKRLFGGRRGAEKYFAEFRADKNGAFEKYSETPHIPELIVSLTSFPARTPTVCKAVETILENTIKPDRIVLYLARPQFPDGKLPKNLTDLMRGNKTVEVRWTDEDIRSYKKLVPALADFPEDFIITVDDDLLYDAGLIKRLLHRHKKEPDSIVADRTRMVKMKDGKFLPYKKWKLFKLHRYLLFGPRPRFRNMATTGAGTLFPPHSLHPDATRADIFMKLCPTTDDLWFWAMAVRRGTKTAVAGCNRRLNPIDGSQKEALWRENMDGKNLNDENVKKISGRFPELTRKLA